MIETLSIELAERRSDILVGSGLLARAGTEIRQRFGERKLTIVTDENVARYHLPALQAALEAARLSFRTLIVPAGEATKDIHRFPKFAEDLLAGGLERKSLLVALGGGVVGDLTGFAAATLLRGIDFVQIPTSLLAQIDSSVGGKTGVNTAQGKNLVGAFHQPLLVLADLEVLTTLPRRELLAGYAEMVKYGILGDAAFFHNLEAAGSDLLDIGATHPGIAMQTAVAHCCRMKAEIVAADEREHGQRALLNLGHTFGHALEAETGFGAALLHGESVALGMVLAANLAVRLGHCPANDAERVRQLLDKVGLPTRLRQVPGAEKFSVAALVAHMGHDKKVADGKLTFVLPACIGRAFITQEVPLAQLESLLESALAA